MRVVVLAVGRLKVGPLSSLFDDYLRRLPWRVELIEVEERRPSSAEERRRREGELLSAKLPEKAVLVALDATGKALSSEAFAAQLRRWQEAEGRPLVFAIGGADGFDPGFRAKADLTLSLGAMTWPHLLVRVMLAEQLYRASTILSGHPYHRG